MAKFYGKVGYISQVETAPGVWMPDVKERNYYGDITRSRRRFTSSENLNGDVNISNEISIVADPFAYENSHYIRYVEFMGALWDVTSVEVQHPRLILTVGGVYNGKQA